MKYFVYFAVCITIFVSSSTYSETPHKHDKQVIYNKLVQLALTLDRSEACPSQVKNRCKQIYNQQSCKALVQYIIDSYIDPEYEKMSVLLVVPGSQPTRCHRKKRKKRWRPSFIFGALADSCFNLGAIAGIAGPEKQAILNSFGTLFSFMSEAVASKQTVGNCNEPVCGQVSQQDFEQHLNTLVTALDVAVTSKTNTIRSVIEFGFADTKKNITQRFKNVVDSIMLGVKQKLTDTFV